MISFIILAICIFCTAFLLNVFYAEYMNAKLNPYTNKDDTKKEMDIARLKLYLIIICSLFWAAYITFC